MAPSKATCRLVHHRHGPVRAPKRTVRASAMQTAGPGGANLPGFPSCLCANGLRGCCIHQRRAYKNGNTLHCPQTSHPGKERTMLPSLRRPRVVTLLMLAFVVPALVTAARAADEGWTDLFAKGLDAWRSP